MKRKPMQYLSTHCTQKAHTWSWMLCRCNIVCVCCVLVCEHVECGTFAHMWICNNICKGQRTSGIFQWFFILACIFSVLFTCVYIWCVTCVDKCMCRCTYCMWACRGPRLILWIFLDHSSTLFSEVGFLNQTQSWLIELVPANQLDPGNPSSEAGIIGEISRLPGIYVSSSDPISIQVF